MVTKLVRKDEGERAYTQYRWHDELIIIFKKDSGRKKAIMSPVLKRGRVYLTIV